MDGIKHGVGNSRGAGRVGRSPTTAGGLIERPRRADLRLEAVAA